MALEIVAERGEAGGDLGHLLAAQDQHLGVLQRPHRAGALHLAEDHPVAEDLAGADARIKAVVLRIDSPGGEVLASDEIALAITEFQKENDKPIIASMGGLAASVAIMLPRLAGSLLPTS